MILSQCISFLCKDSSDAKTESNQDPEPINYHSQAEDVSNKKAEFTDPNLVHHQAENISYEKNMTQTRYLGSLLLRSET